MNKKISLNRMNLYILFGIMWLVPQVILEYIPEQIQLTIIVILMCIFSWIIIFTNFLDKYLIESKGGKTNGRTR